MTHPLYIVAFPDGEPVPTPDQVRGRLSPGNALPLLFQDNTARPDRRGPGFDLAAHEPRKVFRASVLRQGNADADGVQTLAHRRAIQHLAGGAVERAHDR